MYKYVALVYSKQLIGRCTFSTQDFFFFFQILQPKIRASSPSCKWTVYIPHAVCWGVLYGRDVTSKTFSLLWCRREILRHSFYRGMVRHAGRKSRPGFTGLLLVYAWLNMKNITTVQCVVGFFFSYSPGSLFHCCSAEKLHYRKETSWLDSWVRLSPTYPNHSPIRLKWLNYNYLWSRTFPLSCFFSPCIIKHILHPFIGSSSMWPT